ncbi:methyltransferase domain-containing protein [Mycena rosella]|uniref:Methyltransferase domain-containing protein n=1 Tax=Mycena rosella TaxID=1033263 RepID=A0AAD7CN06_MYCRO|nr:methyltransferase domain-containing protein [Mycena rosella]
MRAMSQKTLAHLQQFRVRYAIGAAILMVWALYAHTREPVPAFVCGPELRHSLQESEAEYQDTVRQRKQMIRKYGPSPAQVEAWPTHGQFYTLWDFFPPAYQCPHRVTRLGTLGDGGKYICGMKRVAAKKSCVVYSFGINGDSSFEADVLQRAPGCEVYGYDFSVKGFGPEITADPSLALRAHFFPWALGHADDPTDNPPMYTLQALMRKNGHSFIDILKIDIEGHEYKSLEAFMDAHAASGVLPFGQLQLEIHASGGTEHESFDVILPWWERLEKMGLRPFFSEPNLVYVNIAKGVPNLIEYSFINTRGTHELIADMA